MKHLLALLCCSALIAAAQNLIQNPDFKNGMTAWSLSGPRAARQAGLTSRIADDGLHITLPDYDRSQGVTLLTQSLTLPDMKTYLFEYDIEVENPGIMRHLYQYSEAPWTALGLVRNQTVAPGRTYRIRDIFNTLIEEPAKRRHLTLNLTRLRGKVRLANFRLIPCEYHAFPPLAKEWTVFRNVRPDVFPADIPETLPAADGKTAVRPEQLALDANSSLNLHRPGEKHREKRAAVLYNEWNSPDAAGVRIGFSADWWLEVTLNGEPLLNTAPDGNGSKAFAPGDHVAIGFVKPGRNVLAVRVLSGSGGWRLVCGKTRPDLIFRANESWLPADLDDTHIAAGTALDMSALVPAPAGKHGRLTLNPKGELVFEGQPDRPVRLQGFNGLPQFSITDEDAFRKAVTAVAETARRQGYSLFRVNGILDRTLMRNARKDMEINPAMLDRWDFLLAEFKKQGIYIHLVMLSYQLYDTPAAATRHFDIRNGHRLMLYFGNDWERKHFRYACETLLNHVNPYTGLAWKDDPCIAFLEFYNEQGSGFGALEQNAKAIPGGWELVQARWRRWLTEKYPDGAPAALLPELKGNPLAEAPVPVYHFRTKDTPLANEFGLFRVDIVKEGAQWCEDLVRKIGYRGLTTNYNALKRFADQCARWQVIQVNDHHTYYQHPRGGWGAPGCTVEQNSSLDDAFGVWRGVAAMRFSGRPLIVSEFNFSYWNPYQHEGMLFPAYAAFQNTASLQIHADISRDGIKGTPRVDTFSVGSAPVIRANEFFSNCFFLRGDVTPAKHLVEYCIAKDALARNGMTHMSMDSRQSRIALLTGFAMAFPWAPTAPGTVRGPKADIEIRPEGAADVEEADWFFNVKESKNAAFDLDAFSRKLRGKGILRPGNITDPEREIYETDTGEIVMRAKEHRAKVMTPNSEAVTLEPGPAEPLKRLTVLKTDVHATVGLCSVTDRPLATSDRMVLVYATQNVNSLAIFTPDGRKKIADGRAPVLLRRGRLSLRFTPDSRPGDFALYALAFNGTRRGKLPLTVDGNDIRIDLDTGTIPGGPAVFFELVRE